MKAENNMTNNTNEKTHKEKAFIIANEVLQNRQTVKILSHTLKQLQTDNKRLTTALDELNRINDKLEDKNKELRYGQEWISVGDQLPDLLEDIYLFSNGVVQDAIFYITESKQWGSTHEDIKSVRFNLKIQDKWMYKSFPKPPQGN